MLKEQTNSLKNYKNIHIGKYIKELVKEKGIHSNRICKFLDCNKSDILAVYNSKSLDAEILLKLSKLLEYDFFRIYSQHLILYAPPSSGKPTINSKIPNFRKNIYTKEIIDFILEQLANGEKSKLQIIEEYGIPKTTLYKWISKYGKINTNSL